MNDHASRPTSTPDSDVAGDAVRVILSLFVFFLPLTALLHVRAIVPLSVAAALALIFCRAVREKFRSYLPSRSAGELIFGALMLYLAASVLWSAEPAASAVTFAKVTGNIVVWSIVFAAAAALRTEALHLVLRAAVLGLGCLYSLLVLDVLTKGLVSFHLLNNYYSPRYGYFWLKPAATVLALSIPVIVLYLLRYSKLAAAIVFPLILLTVADVTARTAAVAPLLTLLPAMLFTVLSARAGHALIFLAMASAFLVPVGLGFCDAQVLASQNLPVTSSSTSVIYRLHIWDFVTGLIAQQPFLGWGIGTSKFLGKTVEFIDPSFGYLGEAIPSHPHNVFIQIMLELGIAGAVLSFAAAYSVMRRVDWSGSDGLTKFLISSGFFAILLLLSFNFGLWSSWAFSGFAYVVVLMKLIVRIRAGARENDD